MGQRILVTAGLPYANGSLHLGHLVEYCQADIYVRALRRLGEDAVYICADDAHGTPIEVNAKRLGITPEALVGRFHDEHKRDFARFHVTFDHFSITHSDTNRAIVEKVYAALRAKAALVDREIDGNWCEQDERFLPDRFIKGTCPRCGASDQYGDVCEVCGSTYSPTELKEPHCVLCGSTPVVKKSQHVFFKLSDPKVVAFLRQWVDSGTLQPDVANFVRNWLDGGLRDWCISRDGPYFGFAIPDRPGKFFYVWLDAPFGYVASSAEWGEKHGHSFAELWQSPEHTRVEHFIGKDIIYFHTLFWPAVLHTVGYTLPSQVHVHGMLTVDGEKMSKTRGTFIRAATFAEHIEPQALRYFYACKYGADTSDLDLSLADFVQRVNGELVNKHANLFSRAMQFLHSKLDSRLGDLPFVASAAQQEPARPLHEALQELAAQASLSDADLCELARHVVAACRRLEGFYRTREFGQVIRELASVADIGNLVMQAQKPWDQLKHDPEAARTTCTFAANVCYALAMYLWPIVPPFAEAGARVLGTHIDRFDTSLLFHERRRAIGPNERLFERIDKKAVDALIEASKESMPAPGKALPKHAQGNTPAEPKAPPPAKATIAYDDFAKVDLRVGVVRSAEPVPKSKKLLRLEVDLGEAELRQIVAGIGQVYTAEDLLGKQVVVVANLAPAKLLGVESRGMLLAAGEPPKLALLQPMSELAAGTGIK